MLTTRTEASAQNLNVRWPISSLTHPINPPKGGTSTLHVAYPFSYPQVWVLLDQGTKIVGGRLSLVSVPSRKQASGPSPWNASFINSALHLLNYPAKLYYEVETPNFSLRDPAVLN